MNSEYGSDDLQGRKDVTDFFETYVDLFRYLNTTDVEALSATTVMRYAKTYTANVAALQKAGLSVGFSPDHQAVQVSNGWEASK